MKLSRDELIDRIAHASRGNRKLLAENSTDPKVNDRHAQSFATAIVRHLELLAIAETDEDELIDRIAHASGRNRKLLVQKSSDPEAEATHLRLFATAIIRHLEQSGVFSAKSRM